jgi:primosomal replication protein N
VLDITDKTNVGINYAILSAVLLQKSVLRYTPAGVAVITLHLEHSSQVQQANSLRAIQFSIEATALDTIALTADTLNTGDVYTFEGFWAPAHYRTQRLTFHILALVDSFNTIDK